MAGAEQHFLRDSAGGGRADALYADGPLLAWLKYRKGIDALEELLSVLGTPLEKGFFLRCSSLILLQMSGLRAAALPLHA